MRVLHVISCLAHADGHAQFCLSLASGLAARGHPQQVFTLPTSAEAALPDPMGLACYAQGPVLPLLNVCVGAGWERRIAAVAKAWRPDVVHLHGGWHPLLFAGARVARKMKLPMVLSLHGSLRPVVLEEDRRLRKWLAWRCYQKRLVAWADVIHGTTDMERADIRRLGFKNPVVVVPCGVDVAAFVGRRNREAVDRRWPVCRGKRILLFLSRIHPGKGLDLLVESWRRVAADFPDWHVLIAGPDEQCFERTIRGAVRQAGLADRVTFCGPMYGDDQAMLLASADLFVLPTHGDSFGLVVTESLACGVPVICTKGAPWEELLTERCGWWPDIGVEPLASAFQHAMRLPVSELRAMGQRGRQLMEQKYQWDAVVTQMTAIYVQLAKA